MSDQHEHTHDHVIVPYWVYFAVYIGLLILTVITVLAPLLHLGAIGTLVALLIATCKATLVLLWFMGLKYDRPIFMWMFLVTIGSIGIFLILTYLDYVTRVMPLI